VRNLIPFEFAELGVLEFAWLFLVFAGLSCVASVRSRPRAAIWTALVLMGLGILRYWNREAGWSAWMRLGPVLFVPALGAVVVMVGSLRARLPRRWELSYFVVTLFTTWFAFDSSLSAIEIPFLIWIWIALATALDKSGRYRAVFLDRRTFPPVRDGWLHAATLLVFCSLARPFGCGFVKGLVILFTTWLVFAILAQGREMRRYVKRRLTGAPLVLMIMLAASFFIIRAAPGGPFDKDKRLEPAIKEAIEAEYGMDKPLPIQFRDYMARLVWKGDFGRSFKHKDRSVVDVITDHAPHSVRLGLAAVCLAVLFGVFAGLISGIRQNSIFDYASMAGATLGLALPTFIVGPMLVLLFSMKLGWFNVTGWEDFPRDLVLPAITLALPFMARVARLTRAGMLEVINQDYIRTARAKGLSEPAIVMRHTLKGAMLPVVSFLGPGIAQLLTGSLVVEKIFGVPGLGNEFVQAALNRDYGVAMGLVLVFGTLLIFFNLIVDLVYAFLDPRIRHG